MIYGRAEQSNNYYSLKNNVWNDTIYLVENFGYPKDPEEDLKLSPIEDYILKLDYENICP